MTADVAARTRPARTTTYVWLLLSAITVISWWLAPGHSGGHVTASVPITIAVVLIGLVKGRMIIRYFMEVRSAPRWLRRSTDLWLVVLWTSILVIYLW